MTFIARFGRSSTAQLVLAVAIVAVSFGVLLPAPQAHAIIGGSEADAAKYSYVARIVFSKTQGNIFERTRTESGLCTGTLATPSIVLTAAHCITTNGWKANQGKVTFGYKTGREVTRKITNVTPYSPDGGLKNGAPLNDIALLRLDSAVTDRPTVSFAGTGVLALNTNKTWVTQLGYGQTHTNQSKSKLAKTPLKAAGLQIVARDDTYILTEDPGYDPKDGPVTGKCYVGDSGGPLLASTQSGQQVQVGVFSLYADVSQAITKCYFVRVDIDSKFFAWIRANAASPPQY